MLSFSRYRKLELSFLINLQSNPHLPIWLKGGTPDRILYGTIVTLCIVGCAGVLEFGYSRLYK